jgi:hypothetical protein
MMPLLLMFPPTARQTPTPPPTTSFSYASPICKLFGKNIRLLFLKHYNEISDTLSNFKKPNEALNSFIKDFACSMSLLDHQNWDSEKQLNTAH